MTKEEVFAICKKEFLEFKGREFEDSEVIRYSLESGKEGVELESWYITHRYHSFYEEWIWRISKKWSK